MHTLSIRHTVLLIVGGFIACLCISCSSMSTPEDFEVIALFELPAFNEPSGIAYHADRNTLFVVGDEGDIGEISLDGSLQRQTRLTNASLEGITIDPTANLLYIAVEGADEILQVDPVSFEIMNRYALEQFLGDRKVLTKNKHGLEGVAFIGNPTIGISSLWITNQVLDHKNPQDISGVFAYALPEETLNDNAPLKLQSIIESKTVDLAGIFYHEASSHLFVVSDNENKMIEMDTDGNTIATFSLPGSTQEGITRDHEGFFYIAQDSGGILKLLQAQI